MEKVYAQYGCGLSAPDKWLNFDTSPTLRIQKSFVLNLFLGPFLKVKFPKNIIVGDIIKGLPLEENSVDGLFCSHVLEHLSFDDYHTALENSYKVLKPGGTFRLIMPDLEFMVQSYMEKKKLGNDEASTEFIRDTYMVEESRKRGLRAIAEQVLGNSRHLWLWDNSSTIASLEKVGFKDIRKCKFNDSADEMFKLVEEEDRFIGCVSLEMSK
ncbi:MAG: methyltransferase type 11 [Crocinitomicaceae bacterium]|nr:methyltransferase type 11 [Crocinitomicaceae bacterium]|tara:strand:+ start:5134 stop:5769 length:636 start_codon:yes stop_codon:yes gene_type:complete